MHTRRMRPALSDLPTDPSSRLRQALQLPLANPKIANWLFSDPTKAFHPDPKPLAPASFNDSLILFIRQAIGGVDTPAIHVLLLPVEIIDDIAVGYTHSQGDFSDARLHPFPASAREAVGRFAFDPMSRHIIGVRHGVTELETSIYAVFWYRGNRRQRCYISVPKREYSFENMPETVLEMTVKNEVKTGSVLPKKRRREEDDGGAGCWIGDFERVHPHVLYDLLPRCRDAVPGSGEEGGFEFRRLGGHGKLERGDVQGWLRELAGCLEGRFYSPGVKRSGGGETEEVRSWVFVQDPREDSTRLRMKVSQEYYAFLLPV